MQALDVIECVTHRICGPLFVLDRYFTELAAGRFPRVRSLRQKDEFKDLHQSFQKAVEALKEQKRIELAGLTEAADLAEGLASQASGEQQGDLVRLRARIGALRSSALQRLDEALVQVAQVQAEHFDPDLQVQQVEAISPAQMDSDVRKVIHASADALGLTHVSMASGAGHDAQSFAGLCPVGMVFVPSVGGISHSPREYTRWEDCVNGANVLLHAAIRLAGKRER